MTTIPPSLPSLLGFEGDDTQQGGPATCDDFDTCRAYRAKLLEGTDRLWKIATSLSPPRSSSVATLDDSTVLLRALTEAETGAVRLVAATRIDPGTQLFVVEPSDKRPNDRSHGLLKVMVGALHNNRLHGTVIFVVSGSNANGASRSSGCCIRDSTIGNSIVHLEGARISNSTVENAYVGRHARVESSHIGNGSNDNNTNGAASTRPPSERLTIHVGAESGGQRELVLDAACTMVDATRQLVRCPSNGEPHDKEPPQHPESRGGVTNHVGHHCRVVGTARADRILLYPHASLESALQIENVTLYPHASVNNGCVVTDCLLQWHCLISDLSTVSSSVLMEQSHVGPHSTVSHSVLGPDAHVSNGEIHASILGPNTNAHHQSLVISALWMSGRGNVGYGANVGSNHTGRLPDQEIFVGEGVFFGLSCVVKFPVSLALYTLVAAGTQLAPQRMTLPFSLVANDSLLPGWVLSNSPYTMARAELKVAKRRKATRHNYGAWPVLRPWTVQQCVESRSALLNASPSEAGTKRFTAQDIPGIGACVLTDKARTSGIRAYTDCIQRYALRGLLDQLSDELRNNGDPVQAIRGLRLDQAAPLPAQLASVESDGVPWEAFPWHEDPSTVWDYQRYLLQLEFGPELRSDDSGDGSLSLLLARRLHRLMELESAHARAVQECKQRDDVRGRQVVPGYAASHVAAENDPVVLHVHKAADDVAERVRQVLARLPAARSTADSKL